MILELLFQLAGPSEHLTWQHVALSALDVAQVVLMAWIGSMVAKDQSRRKRK